jgi:hypothetical protein
MAIDSLDFEEQVVLVYDVRFPEGVIPSRTSRECIELGEKIEKARLKVNDRYIGVRIKSSFGVNDHSESPNYHVYIGVQNDGAGILKGALELFLSEMNVRPDISVSQVQELKDVILHYRNR